MFALPHKGYRVCGVFFSTSLLCFLLGSDGAVLGAARKRGCAFCPMDFLLLHLKSPGSAPHLTLPTPNQLRLTQEKSPFCVLAEKSLQNLCVTHPRCFGTIWSCNGCKVLVSEGSPSRQGRKKGGTGQTVCQRDEVIAQQGGFGRKSMLWLDSPGHRSV